MKGTFVIPSYNSAAWLAHAVNSCQKQSFPSLEIVVVDDGSTDSTQKLMEFMSGSDKRIAYIRLPKNMGRSAARNIGNKAATGQFIMVLDADDVAYPERAKLTAAKIKAGADFVHGSCDFIDAIGSIIGDHKADVFSLPRAMKEKENRMVHSMCAYTKDMAMRHQYHDGEAARLGLDDWAFQLECAMSGAKIEHITANLGAYRELEYGISKTRIQDEVNKFKDAYLASLKVTA